MLCQILPLVSEMVSRISQGIGWELEIPVTKHLQYKSW